MSRWLVSADDLDDAQVEHLLVRAAELRAGAAPAGPPRHSALLFLEASLRTRTGFLSAAHRLGWPTPIEVVERRSSEVSMPESLGDTVAVLTAYVDVLVIRLDRPMSSVLPFVDDTNGVLNAGDRGPAAEHPTQALIDLFAMRHLVGELPSLKVAVCGDLRMRSARSLLRLLARQRPRELVLVTDPSLAEALDLPADLGPHRVVETFDQLRDVDALHAVGIPHLGATEEVRTRLRVDVDALMCLSPRGRVFSPMPVIDEIAQTVRRDGRMAYLEQSALALGVRMAVLEAL